MSLIDDIRAEQKIGGQSCTFGRFLLEHGDDDDGQGGTLAATLDKLFDKRIYSFAAIARGLKKTYDDTPSSETIARHNRGECACDR